MAILEKWPDGYVLDMDPRREDPLFYYRREDDWSEAIGLEVQPLYEERTAEKVEVSVFRRHHERELALDVDDRALLYRRSLPVLAARHEHWKQLLLIATDLDAILRGGSLTRNLRDLGFSEPVRVEPDVVQWTRG